MKIFNPVLNTVFNKILAGLAFVVVSLCSHAKNIQPNEQPPLRIAVASNFKNTLIAIVADFKRQHGYPITISSASTGALYQQIIKGAPFDIFFAADELRPNELVKQGLAQHTQLYAHGRMALYSAKTQFNYAQQPQTLPNKCRIGIANPAYAPYGIAAQKVINDIPALSQCQLIKGSNIAQAFQFTQLQTVDLGVVAYSHILEQNIEQSQYQLLNERYSVAQALVVLNNSNPPQLTERAALFVAYLQNANVQQILSHSGYKGVTK